MADQLTRSRTFHRYHVEKVRAHSGTELGTWIGWADQLTHSRTFHRYHVKEVRAHSGTELGTLIGWADQLILTFHPPMLLLHFQSEMGTCIFLQWSFTGGFWECATDLFNVLSKEIRNCTDSSTFLRRCC